MHDDQREKIRALAKEIYKFQNLEDSEKKWIKPLLSRGIVKILEMLDLIENNALTFEEIADDLGIHQTTVSQRINGLIEGGYPISLNGKTAIATTGRPRKLAKRIEELRTPGLLKGETSHTFFEPLPEEELQNWEGKEVAAKISKEKYLEMKELATKLRKTPTGTMNGISYKKGDDNNFLILENGEYKGNYLAGKLARIIMGISEEDYLNSHFR
ncbi:hypothetical protein CCP1ISM_680001 [Azospirillaceae bacterium]